MSWREISMMAVANERRAVVDPIDLGEEVLHYSIPALEQTGEPIVEPSTTIHSQKLLVQQGDILVGRLNPRKGRISTVSKHIEGRTVASTEFVPLVAVGIELRFLAYVLRGEPARQRMDAEVRSVTRSHQRVSPEVISHYRFSAPGRAEQIQVADFLDDQVARIDGTLDYQQFELALLEERRRGTILSAVRGRGVVEGRRDVGPVWLRTLPESWPLVPVASQFEVLLGKMLNEERSSGPFLKPYLRNTNVQWDRIDIDDLKVMDFPPRESARYRLHSGDLLICEGGQPGRSAIWGGEVDELYYQKALHRARSRGRSSPRWFFYVLRAAVAEGAFGDGSGTTIAHLTGEQLRALRLPFPDAGVQASMIVQLDAQMQLIDQLAGELLSKRDLLEERKRALITAAVTGEFDVSTAGPRAAAVVTG